MFKVKFKIIRHTKNAGNITYNQERGVIRNRHTDEPDIRIIITIFNLFFKQEKMDEGNFRKNIKTCFVTEVQYLKPIH
jgi:hypothetical protein